MPCSFATSTRRARASTTGSPPSPGPRASTAGAGWDVIQAGAGDDLLDGGAGNDDLQGGAGSDSYHFARGEGQDRIYDNGAAGETDRLIFAAGITPADIGLHTPGNDSNDLVITLAGGDERILLDNQLAGSGEGVEEILFDDGTLWTRSDIEREYLLRAPSAHNDRLFGFDSDDSISGGAGRDLLQGKEGNDSLFGGAGADTLQGGSGDDSLTGGTGNDTPRGEAGSDSYHFALGDGRDDLYDLGDAGDIDSLHLGTGIAPADIGFHSPAVDSKDIVLTIAGTNDRVLLNNQNGAATEGIEEIHFADGTLWTRAEIEQQYVLRSPSATNDRIFSFAGDDTIDGGLGDDLIEGRAGADSLSGGAGRDTLRGGADDDQLTGGSGNDRLEGGAGSDDYHFNLGDGQDDLYDNGASGDLDRLIFGAGIAEGDIGLHKPAYDGQDLVLTIAGTNDRILLNNQEGAATEGIEEVHFADGTVWSRQDLLDRFALEGTSGQTVTGVNPTGGAGDDWLYGDGVFHFDLGQGSDILQPPSISEVIGTDRLYFGSGIGPQDLIVRPSGSSLVLIHEPTGDQLVVRNQEGNYLSADFIDYFHFDDGTVWSWANMVAQFNAQVGSDGNDYIVGFPDVRDHLTGGPGTII